MTFETDKETIYKNYEREFANNIIDYICKVEALGGVFVGVHLGIANGAQEHIIYNFCVDNYTFIKEAILKLHPFLDDEIITTVNQNFDDLFIYQTFYI